MCRCKLKGYAWATGLALFLFFAELGGGIFSKSLALLGDAWHVLSDIFVYGASAYALTLKLREVSPQAIHEIDKKWGNRNASILMTVASINIILAIVRLVIGHDHVLTGPMLLIATGGLVGNGIMLGLLLMLGLDHGNSPEHTHVHKHASKSLFGGLFSKLGGWVHMSAITHTATDLLISVVVVGTAFLMESALLKGVLGISSWSHGEIDSMATIIISLMLFGIARHIKKEIAHDHHHH
ncbi:MAG: cation transporter [Patescibacteria group bacterium]|nr:cation transporter [Patescibacteria group bacterium]